MTAVRLTIAVTLSMLCAGITTAQVRDPGVRHSIFYEVVGNQNHVYPIVFLSTRHFKTTPEEFLTVLSPHRYHIVSAFTHAQLVRPECPGTMPAEDIWYSVQITVHYPKRTRTCILPRALACDYFTGVVKLPGINWSEQELLPIRTFMAEVQCHNAFKVGAETKS